MGDPVEGKCTAVSKIPTSMFCRCNADFTRSGECIETNKCNIAEKLHVSAQNV
jgi:hypothetical protein